MAIVTISGDVASRWEEIAAAAARLLSFEHITEAKLAQWFLAEFGEIALPAKAWQPAAQSLLARAACERDLVVAIDGSETLFEADSKSSTAGPSLVRVNLTAPENSRIGNVMYDSALNRADAQQRLAQIGEEANCVRRERFGRQASHSKRRFDVIISLSHIDPDAAAQTIAAAARDLAGQGRVSCTYYQQIQFDATLALAKHGVHPVNAHIPQKTFGHPSEQLFANLLDFYRIAWEYEPRSFPLQWDKNGKVTEAFTPDFYLPESDLYVELTTMKQSLVTRKNRKIKLLRAIYPHVNIQIFYQKDFQDLVSKYGLKAS